MNRITFGGALAVAGIVVLLVSLLADPLGIGEGDGFGWKQTAGSIVGAALLAAGLIFAVRSRDAALTTEQ